MPPLRPALATRTWFTADLHLGHANILRYCRRPFLSPAEEVLLHTLGPRGNWRVSRESTTRHDAELLAAINAAVAPDDRLWVVGDFSLGDAGCVREYRRRIRCRNVGLISGNHDRPDAASVFELVADNLTVEADGRRFWLCHYPHRDWPGRDAGVWHLYGHVHGRLHAADAGERASVPRCDVGVDVWSYLPVSVPELVAHLSTGAIRGPVTAGE